MDVMVITPCKTGVIVSYFNKQTLLKTALFTLDDLNKESASIVENFPRELRQ